MSELRQRQEPIRSKALRRAAKGQRCTLNLPGICNYDPETVVLAHIHDEQFGRSQKADDTSGMHCCSACHTAYDLHRTGLDALALLQLVFRAYQRTIRRLVQMEEIRVTLDKPLTGKSPVKRKPKAKGNGRPIRGRTAIQSPGFADAHRPLTSRNDLRKRAKATP